MTTAQDGGKVAYRNTCLNKKDNVWSTQLSSSYIIFDKELYMFRTDLLSIIRSFNTLHAAIGICHASCVDRLLARSGWSYF